MPCDNVAESRFSFGKKGSKSLFPRETALCHSERMFTPIFDRSLYDTATPQPGWCRPLCPIGPGRVVPAGIYGPVDKSAMQARVTACRFGKLS